MCVLRTLRPGSIRAPLFAQANVVRLQEELQSSQGMLAAKQEGEALLKAEMGQLLEEVARLREEAVGLQERAADGDAAQV